MSNEPSSGIIGTWLMTIESGSMRTTKSSAFQLNSGRCSRIAIIVITSSRFENTTTSSTSSVPQLHKDRPSQLSRPWTASTLNWWNRFWLTCPSERDTTERANIWMNYKVKERHGNVTTWSAPIGWLDGSSSFRMKTKKTPCILVPWTTSRSWSTW